MKEIEFVCCNPKFDDATRPESQIALMNSLRSVPGLHVYREDWGDGQTSLAAIMGESAPKHAHQTIKSLAKRHGVKIDLVQDTHPDKVEWLESGGTGTDVTHYFRT